MSETTNRPAIQVQSNPDIKLDGNVFSGCLKFVPSGKDIAV